MSLDLEALRNSGMELEDLKVVLEGIIRDPGAENKDRIKAVELLAKLRGDLVAGGAPKSGNIKHEVVIVQTPKLPSPKKVESEGGRDVSG